MQTVMAVGDQVFPIGQQEIELPMRSDQFAGRCHGGERVAAARIKAVPGSFGNVAQQVAKGIFRIGFP